MPRTALSTLRLTAAILFAIAASQVTAQAQHFGATSRSPEGVWLVRITPKNCSTGAPIPAGISDGLYTFHKDGTLSAWVQNAQISTTRSPSHGLWRRQTGWNAYQIKFVHLRYDSTGKHIGRQEAEASLVLSDDLESFTTEGTTSLFDAAGNPGTQGCSTSFGTRYQ